MYDDGSLLHVLADRSRGADERAEIRPVGTVDGCRHRNNDEVGLGKTARIGGDRQLLGSTQRFRCDLTGRIDVPAVGRNFLFRKIVTDGTKLLTELNSERQTDVAQADDGDDGMSSHAMR